MTPGSGRASGSIMAFAVDRERQNPARDAVKTGSLWCPEKL